MAQNIPISHTLQRLQNWAYYRFMTSRKIMTQKRTTGLIHISHYNSETENELPIIMYNCQFTVSQNSFCMVLAKTSFSSTSSFRTLPHTHHLKFLVPINLLFTPLNVLVKALSDEMAWCLFLLTYFFIRQKHVCFWHDIPSLKSWDYTFLVSGWQQMCV